MPTSQPSTAETRRVEEIGHPQRWTVLGVLCAVAFMAQLDLFIVNVALPAIGRSFPGQDLSNLSWVLNAYAIVFAACLVPAGRLADTSGAGDAFLLVSPCSHSHPPSALGHPTSPCSSGLALSRRSGRP
jgi:MFS family permease